MGTKTIWYLSCPVCRRRQPAASLIGRAEIDTSAIDFPAHFGVSLGHYGFKVSGYVSWTSLKDLPREVLNALSVFIARVAATYALIKQLGLLPAPEFDEIYSDHPDDLHGAYSQEAQGYNGY